MRAKKYLSQNFLTNGTVARAVATAGGVSENDTVLEIGPGKGILTEILLLKAKRVVAVEKDKELIAYLERKFENEIATKKLILIEGDAICEKTIHETMEFLEEGFKQIANIPYAITGQILRTSLSSQSQPEAMSLLVQKEVAERVVARGGKESILSISVKVYGRPKYIKTVKKENFLPTPKVDSAILSITDISKDFFGGRSEEAFFEILHTGFRHKRKFVKNNLKELTSINNLTTEHIPDRARAEDLTTDDWRKMLPSNHF